MAKVHHSEFRREAVRIALTSGQPRWQVAFDLGVGFSTLAKWIQKSRPGELPPKADIDLAKNNDRLHGNDYSHLITTKHPQGWPTNDRDRAVDQVDEI